MNPRKQFRKTEAINSRYILSLLEFPRHCRPPVEGARFITTANNAPSACTPNAKILSVVSPIVQIVGTPFVDRPMRRNGSSDLLLLLLGRENAPETNDHWRHCLRVGMWDRVAINSVGLDGQ